MEFFFWIKKFGEKGELWMIIEGVVYDMRGVVDEIDGE